MRASATLMVQFCSLKRVVLPSQMRASATRVYVNSEESLKLFYPLK